LNLSAGLTGPFRKLLTVPVRGFVWGAFPKVERKLSLDPLGVDALWEAKDQSSPYMAMRKVVAQNV
jgi:hypothetical protein